LLKDTASKIRGRKEGRPGRGKRRVKMGLFRKKEEGGGTKNAVAAWKEKMNDASNAAGIVKRMAAGEAAPVAEGNDMVKRCETLMIRINHVIRTIYGGEGADAENIAAGNGLTDELISLTNEMNGYIERNGGGPGTV